MRSSSAALLVGLALIVGGCAAFDRLWTEALPSGGVSRDDAVALARQHVSMVEVTSASAGTFGAVNPSASNEPGVAPADRWVWAVTFSGDVTICSPLGVCTSPRPATSTVYLDYFTGAFIETSTVSPAR